MLYTIDKNNSYYLTNCKRNKPKIKKNLGFNCIYNSRIAERHQRQWQKIAENDGKKCDAFYRGMVLVDAECYAHARAVDIR